MESNTRSIFRSDYIVYANYRAIFRELCKTYGYKVRVVGGWKFFTFKQDYDLWKRTK